MKNDTTNKVTASPICPTWCDGFHPEEDGETLSAHGRTLAEGRDTDTHGPIYKLELQQYPDDRAELWVQIHTLTLTAEMAEVLAAGLMQGAQAMRASTRAADTVTLESFQNSYLQWQHFGPLLPGDPIVDVRAV